MTARRFFALLVLALVTSVAVATPAEAQRRFDTQFFRPTPMQRSNPVGLWSADVLPDGSFELGVMGHYDSRPLVVRDGDTDIIYNIVGEQTSLHLMGGFGILDLLEIGADIPIIVQQSGQVIPTLPNFDVGSPTAGAGIGDVRLAAKLQFFTTHTQESPGGAAMALVVEGSFPSGDRDAYQGGEWRISPRLVIDGVTAERHRVSLNLGYTYREETEVAGLSIGGTFDWGLAAHFRSEYIHVIPEIRGSLVTTASDLGFEEIPVEAGITFRILPISQLQIQAGGSVGLFQGFGAPDFRVLLGVSWLQVPDGDRDGDGIPNSPDQCPDVREDFDHFEDEDGCPDPDNDGDGILDEPDACPNEPEDLDGFEDENGCPDPDNDQDGILDQPDQCPDEPEDMNGVDDEDGCPEIDTDGDGLLDPRDECPNDPEDIDQFEDENGCPDPDNDGDGVLDEPDECPMDPEDIDQFEDENGCPDPDNDQDGILDEPDRCPNEPEDMNGIDDEDGCPEVDTDGDGLLDPVDQCPTDPEDMDGFEDENGCPDPDNDGDGILDTPDRCPNEPEVVNGFEDEDGCPDESVITVTCQAIEIRDHIYFATNRDVIRRRSHGLLDQLASVLGSRPDIRRVSVEGHTDDRGRDRHNLDLSTRRAAAVVRYLVARGIAAERLTSQGFGEARPIEANRTRAGRAANRRVEFVITEQEGCQDEAAATP